MYMGCSLDRAALSFMKYGVTGSIKTPSGYLWMLPKYLYTEELQARVTAQHLQHLLQHFYLPEDISITFAVTNEKPND
jgi:hypothetical protein